jgi:hypothetical protein
MIRSETPCINSIYLSAKKLLKKHLIIPSLLAVVLASLALTSAYADPLFLNGYVTVGDQYLITTTSGDAHAWINGAWITGSADLQLQVQVTFVGAYNVVFRILSGSFQVLGKDYTIDVGHWRGNYDLLTHSSEYQGPATAPDGGQAYFDLFGQDTGPAGQSVHVNIVSDFRGEYGALWHINISALRTASI